MSSFGCVFCGVACLVVLTINEVLSLNCLLITVTGVDFRLNFSLSLHTHIHTHTHTHTHTHRPTILLHHSLHCHCQRWRLCPVSLRGRRQWKSQRGMETGRWTHFAHRRGPEREWSHHSLGAELWCWYLHLFCGEPGWKGREHNCAPCFQ